LLLASSDFSIISDAWLPFDHPQKEFFVTPSRRYVFGILFGVIAALNAISSSAQNAPATTAETPVKTAKKASGTNNEFLEFMRIRRDSRKRPVALETSITRYEGVNSDGKKFFVDLIGVVHVGEREYYLALNEQFQQYDATLYELVAPEGTRIPKGGRAAMDEGEGVNPIAALQLGMKSMLGLEFQLDHIDYTASSLVHADMSPEEFFESMKKNEESVGRMLINSLGSSMAMQNKGQSAEIGLALSMFSKDPTKSLRRTMAEQMQDMEGGMTIFNGKDGSTIINHRNSKVMEVLRSELKKGHDELAIFYGAGHLPDMQKKLLEDFQMKRAGKFWLTAWDLNIKRDDKSSSKAGKK
jgi:hypothetical protein